MIVRRISLAKPKPDDPLPKPPGPDRGGETPALGGCPDVFELDDGSFAVIGIRKTDLLKNELPPGPACGFDEEIVIVPRQVLLQCRDELVKMK